MISQCVYCSNFIPTNKFACLAFPDGIPEEVFENRHDHRKLYPGDNGILFTLLTEGKNDDRRNELDKQDR